MQSEALILATLETGTLEAQQQQQKTIDEFKSQIYAEGMCSIKSAFPREWAMRLREDYEVLMQEARSLEGGTINRGPNRFYHAIYAERLSGFIDLVTHPVFV